MEYTRFGSLAHRASVLGFGCASMGSRYGKRESLRALAAAYDGGVNYFDVARSYGYGEAEAILGAFIRDRRGRVIVATKFGIDPPTHSRRRRMLKGIARQLFRAVPALRVASRGRLGSQFTRPPLTVAAMIQSVETSLTQLRTDYVDVVHVHDCTEAIAANDDLFDALDRLVASGKVRSAGVSGPREIVESVISRRSSLGVAQFQHDLFQPSVSHVLQSSEHLATVGYQPFGGEQGTARLRELLQRARHAPSLALALRDKLFRLTDDEATAALALSGARIDGGLSVVLASMFSLRHIASNVQAVASAAFTPDDMASIRALSNGMEALHPCP